MVGAADNDRQATLGYWLIFVAVTVGSVAFGFLMHGRSPAAWRTAGGLLEVLGLCRAAVAIDAKVARFTGRPRWSNRIQKRLSSAVGGVRRRWRRLLARLRRGEEDNLHQSVGTGTAEATFEARPVGIIQTPPKRLNLDERVAKLEDGQRLLHEEIRQVKQEARRRDRDQRERMERLRDDLQEADREVKQLVKRHALGGFEWELVSLGWFLAGVAVATWGPLLPWP